MFVNLQSIVYVYIWWNKLTSGTASLTQVPLVSTRDITAAPVIVRPKLAKRWTSASQYL